ncbi:MAG: MATE family efflux transporter [Acidaminobacteraceae bacterium]
MIRREDMSENLSKWQMIKNIINLGVPVIVENILIVLLGVVDMYFVGKIGTDAIAGVGITNLIVNIYTAFFIAIGIGTTAVVSRNIGAKKLSLASEDTKQAIMLGLIIGAIVALINLAFGKNIMQIIGAKSSVVDGALPYYMVITIPLVFLCLNVILSSVLRGAGDTRTPMKAGLISNLINIVLDYILIFGIMNFSGLGIVGAALATTISRIISVIVLMNSIMKGKNSTALDLSGKWKIRKDVIKSITMIGIPAGVEKLIMRSGQVVYGSMIVSIGTSAYAAHNVAGTIESVTYLPAMGFGIAASTLIGQNLGAKKIKEARMYGLYSYYISAVFMSLMGILMYLFAPSLAKLFTKDIIVIKQSVQVVRLIALFQPMLCVTVVIASALQGAGDTKFPMYSSLIGIWGIRVLGVYILAINLNFGLLGVWIAYAADISIRAIILMIRYLRGKWTFIEI